MQRRNKPVHINLKFKRKKKIGSNIELLQILLIFLLSVSWEVSVLSQGTRTVDLFKDRQRADFAICSSHTNPMFCVPSYSFPVPRAATGYSRVSTGQKAKWLGFLFRFCCSVTLAKSTAENFKFPISALLTRECLRGSWDDALPWGSRSLFPCLQTHTHRFKGVSIG